jgi:endonuclease/exonuclease/phosphatase (EEP) superfamily protein YafD
LIFVYGPAYEEKKVEFIDELHSIMAAWQGPILFGGDFNLCRSSVDKNNGRINKKIVDCFNDWINK